MDIELDRQIGELMVSNYDTVLRKTTWQCAQCHFSSKVRSTVKEHIETHISGFSHPCPICQKTCKTRNALRVHKIQAHKNKSQSEGQQQQQHQGIINQVPQVQPQLQVHHEPQHQPQPQPQPQVQQNSMPIAKKSVQVEQKPMYQPEPQKEQPRQGIMNHPMIGRPMYGHPMMMGHPMI